MRRLQERRTGPTLSRVAARAVAWPAVAGAAGAVVIVDQLTKQWALGALSDGDIDLVGSLRLRLAFNSGAAFGLGAGVAPILALIAFVAVLGLLRSGRLGAGWAVSLAAGLVLGGAVGNLIDRALREGSGFMGGGVVDFIDLQWWPVFNVADMSIVAGGVLLAVVGRPPEPAPSGPDVDAG